VARRHCYELFKRDSKSLVNGVSSTCEMRDPYPAYFAHGRGSKIYSVDGWQHSDFHNGFGSMVQGHVHPALIEAIRQRRELGTQFALPTQDPVIIAEHLADNFRLPKWRFVNSGSEATTDAIRIGRAFTDRKQVVKIFGSYHGHHDYLMVNLGVADWGDINPRENYNSVSYGAGIPKAVTNMAAAAPFDDVPTMEARIEQLTKEGRRPACVIMEAAMMNLGVVRGRVDRLCAAHRRGHRSLRERLRGPGQGSDCLMPGLAVREGRRCSGQSEK